MFAALGAASFLLLAGAYVGGGQVVAVDDDVSRWAAGGLPWGVEWPARLVTDLGGGAGSVVVTAIVAVALWRAAQHVDAIFVVGSVAGIMLVVAVLKACYERARPDGGSPIPLPHSSSFPSGHAATAVVLYGAIGILLAGRAGSWRRAVGWLLAAAVLALAIGCSRALLNVHFVSDVLAGFSVGLAWLCACALVRDCVVASRRRPVTDDG